MPESHRGARWVQLTEILALAPAYGDSWDGIVASMTADPVESVTVDLLAAELRSGRRLREPIVADFVEGVVHNGTHRIVAAIVAGADGLEVCDDLADDDEVIEVTFRARLEAPPADPDDADDLVFSALRSFPIAQRWTEAWGMSRRGDVHTGVWVWPHDEAAVLADALVARGAAFGIVVSVEATAPYDTDPLLDEPAAP